MLDIFKAPKNVGISTTAPKHIYGGDAKQVLVAYCKTCYYML